MSAQYTRQYHYLCEARSGSACSSGGLGLAAQASCLLLPALGLLPCVLTRSRSCTLQGLGAVVERALLGEGYACASACFCFVMPGPELGALSTLGKNSPTELSPELFYFISVLLCRSIERRHPTARFPGAFRWIMAEAFSVSLGTANWRS